jgi:hypothetical protein
MKKVQEKKLTKAEQKQVKDFQQKWKEHKEQYIKDHSIEEMVYENGSALAVLYKEVQRLSSLIVTIINKENGNQEIKSSK